MTKKNDRGPRKHKPSQKRASLRQRKALERARAIAISRLPPRDPFALITAVEPTGPAAPIELAFPAGGLPVPIWERQAQGRLTPQWKPLPNPPEPPPPLALTVPPFASGLSLEP